MMKLLQKVHERLNESCDSFYNKSVVTAVISESTFGYGILLNMQIAQCRAVSYGAIDQNATAGDNNGCPRLILAARVALSRPGDSYQSHVCGDPEVIGDDGGEQSHL